MIFSFPLKTLPKISNRQIAKAVGVDEKTVCNDRAEKSAPGGKKASKPNGGGADKSAPG